MFLLVPAALFELGGSWLLIVGYLVPRILLYPQLAWMSLLVEHNWFEPVPADADRDDTEVHRRKSGARVAKAATDGPGRSDFDRFSRAFFVLGVISGLVRAASGRG